MEQKYCTECGEVMHTSAKACPKCGAVVGGNGIDSVKNKIVAGILAICFGGIGIHKFYLGRILMGIVYILFCWTLIPSIIAFFEGIIYLCMDEDKFNERVRLGVI